MYARATIFIALMAVTLIGCDQNTATEKSMTEDSAFEEVTSKEGSLKGEITELKIENLLTDLLELEDSIEVIMSMVEVPPNTTLPTHYHPGEEFIYLIEGSGVLNMEGDSALVVNAGDVSKVPLKRIHSFSTREHSAKAIVFRVHEQGQPHRILVDDEKAHEH